MLRTWEGRSTVLLYYSVTGCESMCTLWAVRYLLDVRSGGEGGEGGGRLGNSDRLAGKTRGGGGIEDLLVVITLVWW